MTIEKLLLIILAVFSLVKLIGISRVTKVIAENAKKNLDASDKGKDE